MTEASSESEQLRMHLKGAGQGAAALAPPPPPQDSLLLVLVVPAPRQKQEERPRQRDGPDDHEHHLGALRVRQGSFLDRLVDVFRAVLREHEAGECRHQEATRHSGSGEQSRVDRDLLFRRLRHDELAEGGRPHHLTHREDHDLRDEHEIVGRFEVEVEEALRDVGRNSEQQHRGPHDRQPHEHTPVGMKPFEPLQQHDEPDADEEGVDHQQVAEIDISSRDPPVVGDHQRVEEAEGHPAADQHRQQQHDHPEGLFPDELLQHDEGGHLLSFGLFSPFHLRPFVLHEEVPESENERGKSSRYKEDVAVGQLVVSGPLEKEPGEEGAHLQEEPQDVEGRGRHGRGGEPLRAGVGHGQEEPAPGSHDPQEHEAENSTCLEFVRE